MTHRVRRQVRRLAPGLRTVLSRSRPRRLLRPLASSRSGRRWWPSQLSSTASGLWSPRVPRSRWASASWYPSSPDPVRFQQRSWSPHDRFRRCQRSQHGHRSPRRRPSAETRSHQRRLLGVAYPLYVRRAYNS